MNIEIYLKSGEIRKFTHEGRAGGSYTNRIRYVGPFVIVTDEWENEFAFPAGEIREIQTHEHVARD